MVAGDGDDRRPEPAQEGCCAVVLAAPPPMRQVARGDDQLGAQSPDERAELAFHVGRVAFPDVQVGDVQNPGWHGRLTL